MMNTVESPTCTKPMLAVVFLLREWMPFSDQETSIFQHYFMDYFLENESKLSKKDVYKLACLANETQYQIRLLKARISGDGNIDEISNNRFIKILMSFEGIIEFVRDKMISGFENTSIENKYKLMNEHYSYFTASDAIKDSIKQDFDLYFGS
ncbi:MAG: hypothetical protein QG556_562 [Pseudomonadota bacterium]|nr:hypothetical protein [Pseudomonadota bacterium]